MTEQSQTQRNLAEHKATQRGTVVARFKIEVNAALERLTEGLAGIDDLDSLFKRAAPKKKATANGEPEA